jgi:hypothetical protein
MACISATVMPDAPAIWIAALIMACVLKILRIE